MHAHKHIYVFIEKLVLFSRIQTQTKMKKHIIIVLCLLITLHSLYSSAQKKSSASKSQTKYGVVIATMNEPKLMPCLLSEKSNSSISGFRWMPGFKEYVSKVITIENYTEEKKYRIQDTFRYDMEKEMDLDNTLIRDEEGRHHIVSVMLLVYSTYKEASEMRNGK